MTLKDQLLAATEELKVAYLKSVEVQAVRHYEVCLVRKQWKEVDWCRYFNITPRVANEGTGSEFLSFPTNFYNTDNARRLRRMQDDVYRTLRLTQEQYVAKQHQLGLDHYHSSIDKLLLRLNKKGITEETKINIINGSVGINMNLMIEHDGKITRAWTIVAEGEVNITHYRYLVK